MKLIGLIFCIFMGMTAISMGFGALYPPLNLVAAPLVCPDGEMSYQTRSSHPLPGRTYIQARYTCVGPHGATTPIGMFPLCLYAGTVYGVALFVLIWAVSRLAKLGGAARPKP